MSLISRIVQPLVGVNLTFLSVDSSSIPPSCFCPSLRFLFPTSLNLLSSPLVSNQRELSPLQWSESKGERMVPWEAKNMENTWKETRLREKEGEKERDPTKR